MTVTACSIIIPSYRSMATICRCLQALLAQDFAQPYEIIVVDSSPDATADLVRAEFPQVHLLHLARQTDPATARNLGAQQARGTILAFIDADCIAPRDWLRRLHTTILAGYDAVGGAIANANGVNSVSWAGYICEFREFFPSDTASDVANLTLGNAAYRKRAFLAAGGFPVGYFPQEDQVFHRAFCAHGFAIRLDQRIVVAHHHRTERADFLSHQRRIGYANAQVLRRIVLPGAALARRPRLALAALPALVLLRFARTLAACRGLQASLVWRHPDLVWLIWLGMWQWGLGFLEGSGPVCNGSVSPVAVEAIAPEH